MTPSANTSVSGNALAALDAELERLDCQLADARRAAFAACAELADAWLRKGRLLAECGRTEEAARAFVTAAEHAGQARGGEFLPATLGNGQAPADRAALLRALDAAAACLPAGVLGGLRQTLARAGLRQALEARATAAGPGEPASCHNLALFHLAEGNRFAAADDLGPAVSHWERATAYAAVPLADSAYVHDWGRRRFADYQATAAEALDGLAARLVQQVEALFMGWAERLRAAGRGAATERVAALVPQLRAELRVAQLLRSLGGLPLEAAPGGKVAAGPAYLRMQGLDAALETFLAGLKVRRSGPKPPPPPDADLITQLDAILDFGDEDEGGVEAVLRTELERLCSPFCLAAVHERDGGLHEALQTLRDVRRGLGEEAKRWETLAADFETELLLKLGEQALASREEVAAGVGHFTAALAAAAAAKKDAVAGRVRQAALGRAKALQEAGRPEEAVELLEAVNRLCGDAELQGMLPALYASRGIAAGNAKRWQEAVDDLRQARKLNPHSRQAGENLVTALRARGGELCRKDPEPACVLLEEAVAVAEECLRGDPGSGPLEEQARLARRELAVALNAHALFLNDLGRSDDALALLRRARELDPEDATLRQNEADIAQARRARALVAGNNPQGALDEVLRSVYEEEAE